MHNASMNEGLASTLQIRIMLFQPLGIILCPFSGEKTV